MRAAIAVGLGVATAALLACSKFDAATDPPDAAVAVDGGDGGGPQLDSGLGVNLFCTGAMSGVLFCSDFQTTNFASDWPEQSAFNGMFLRAKDVGDNRTAHVSGTMEAGAKDFLLTATLTLPPAFAVITLELDVMLNQALSEGEIAVLDTGAAITSPTIYLSNQDLKLQVNGGDLASATMAIGQWSHVVLTLTSTETKLTVNGVGAPAASPIQGLAGLTVQLAAGLYFKQDLGSLDYGLDNIRLSAK